MLAQYKKPRKNPSAIVQQKKVVEKKRQAKAEREAELTDSDVSDSSSSDSEYEEILISNLKKKIEPLPSPKIEEPVSKDLSKQPPPKIEAPLPSPKIEAPPKPKPKKPRKKIVIKKYYQQRESKTVEKKPEKQMCHPRNTGSLEEAPPKSKPIPIPQPQRTSYIGLGGVSNTSQTSHSMRNRLLNW